MKSISVVLVSPSALDGYPPVQYQAKLLADAGMGVQIVTTSLWQKKKYSNFSYPGVKVICLSPFLTFFGKLTRNISFLISLFIARIRGGGNVVEICYDPIGLFLSDLTPCKPKKRIAHFHELLQYPNSYLELRLKKSIENYNLVVVPDEARADHTRKQLNLKQRPLVVENYPLRSNSDLFRVKSSKLFEVVYCGALGFNQKLDIIISSISFWANGACLVLIGNCETVSAMKLRELAEALGVADRVKFLGWMDVTEAERRMSQANLGIGLLNPDSEQMRTALGASNKRFQYMKAGLPQIGDQNPGIPELIEGNKVGICLKNYDLLEIAKVVSQYMNDPKRCIEEGNRAFELHMSLFNYNRVFSRLLSHIEGNS